LPHRLAQKHQRREQAGEELRLLYVAMTRARDNLILTGSVTEKKWETLWNETGSITSQKILAAKSYADWLGLWFANQVQSPKSKVQSETRGGFENLSWRVFGDEEMVQQSETKNAESKMELPPLDEAAKEKMRAVLGWNYAFENSTKRAAKSSVTALRRQAEESDDEAEPVFNFQFSAKRTVENLKSQIANRKLSAADAGTAHHKFLQHFNFESADNLKSLAAESERLEREKILSADERAALDLNAVAAFWNSDAGQKICKESANVRRELAFTAKFSPAELSEIIGTKSGAGLEKEFVVVQGVADLVVLLPDEIWLADFKTDEVRADTLAGKIQIYGPQLKLYVRALAKIYSRPVKNCWLHFLSAQKTVDVKI
jgi:ATP-dependent helicase/nuclease subunit A